MTIKGRLTYAGSSRMHEAILVCKGDRFRLLAADGTDIATGAVSDFRFAAPVGRTPRRVTLPDGALFETDQLDALDALNPADNTLHRAEAFRPRLAGFVLATMLAVWVVWRYGVGVLVAVAVWLTPPNLARILDEHTLRSMDRFVLEPTSLATDEQAALQNDFDRLTNALTADEGHTPMRLKFRSGPMGPNAFAMPGGTIVLTDELVRLSDDPDMIAGVMGHEIGHVTHRHSLRQIYRALGIYAVVGFLAGDTGPVLESLLLEGNLLLQLAYSREHEFEADAFAVDIVHRAGFDPHGLVRFFDHLTEMGLNDPLPSWGSSHPSHERRVEVIREQIRMIGAH
ncbi:M48 family metallopeptidase [Roseinatronobacter sp. S2]|uniref:M48 family metallopeptidase n=1 Tax=Roseinatronobacter sp. S2 TaxID=3035471 RepID=UPI002410B08A|nr:M48 family metallopeptidase [Roseinatronobacter sp. S2]WFE76930.1 M48 family metallopeptidase [Roseinatronobacter sp. S2]